MTINSSVRKAGPYTGNAATTSFPFSFKVFERGDVLVTHSDENGIETVLVLDVDYSVHLNPDQGQAPGGVITYPLSAPPLPNNEKITLSGNLPYNQPTDITNQGGFYPRVIEDALDRIVVQVQQLQEQLQRTLQAPISGGYDMEQILAQLEEELQYVTAVYNSLQNIEDVLDNETNINTVATNINNVNKTGDNIAEVVIVAGISIEVVAVAGNNINVSKVANNETNINKVANNETNINKVEANETNINIVAADITNVNTVAGSIGSVNNVAGINAEVQSVSGNKTNINTVASISDEVAAVAGIKTEVVSVDANKTNINSVSFNKSNIDKVADNIGDVKNAFQNAQAAIAARNQAEEFAIMAGAAVHGSLLMHKNQILESVVIPDGFNAILAMPVEIGGDVTITGSGNSTLRGI